MTAEELAPLLYHAAMSRHEEIPAQLARDAWDAMSPDYTGKWLVIAGEAVSRLAPPRLYGLTATEWLHLAGEGDGSEVQPCCGNLSEVRELLNALATLQSPDDTGMQLAIGRHLLEVLGADGDGHGLDDEAAFPLLHRVLAGVRAQLASPPWPYSPRKEGSS